jgi:dephospho-CoA kinase
MLPVNKPAKQRLANHRAQASPQNPETAGKPAGNTQTMQSVQDETPSHRQLASLMVGLTGGIACGKSHATRAFSELGAHIIDADAIAHELIQYKSPAYQEIVDCFGPEILDLGAEINRKKLGSIIFHNAVSRERLNAILHPKIIEEENRRSKQIQEQCGSSIIIVDAALMIEAGYHTRFDKLVVVHCKPELQLHRLMSRDSLDYEDAQARVDSQMPIAQKLKLADYIIETSGTYRQTRFQIDTIHGLLVRDLLAKIKPSG